MWCSARRWSLLVVLLAVAAIALRLYRLRVAGVPIIMRYVPAEPEHGWRHGTLRYDDHELRYYRLSSMRPGPQLDHSPRSETEIVGRRAPQGTEFDIIDADMVIVHAVTPGGEASSRSPATGSPRSSPGSSRARRRRRCARGDGPPSSGRNAPRAPPGRHSTSPSGLATRDQDEQQVGQPVEVLGRQRGEWCPGSLAWPPTPHAPRAATTVRATCRYAASGVPPAGRTNSAFGRSALN